MMVSFGHPLGSHARLLPGPAFSLVQLILAFLAHPMLPNTPFCLPIFAMSKQSSEANCLQIEGPSKKPLCRLAYSLKSLAKEIYWVDLIITPNYNYSHLQKC